MPHPLPLPLVAFLYDLGMFSAKLAVERNGGTNAVAVECFHQPEHPDAIAVITRRPSRDIRHRRAAASCGGRHFFIERKELDIRNNPER
jgi:hypothetical protein